MLYLWFDVITLQSLVLLLLSLSSDFAKGLILCAAPATGMLLGA